VDSAAREARVGENSKTQRHGTGRARKRDRLLACLKRSRHILHTKVDGGDQYERLERVEPGSDGVLRSQER
jgi:hypothetical protein